MRGSRKTPPLQGCRAAYGKQILVTVSQELSAEYGRKLRNRDRARVARARPGLVEQWGSGIQRLISACHDTGLATPVFEEICLTPRATRTRFSNLAARGLVRHLGTGPQDPRRRYYVQE